MRELFAQPLFHKLTYATRELKTQPLFHKLVCVTMLVSSLQHYCKYKIASSFNIDVFVSTNSSVLTFVGFDSLCSKSNICFNEFLRFRVLCLSKVMVVTSIVDDKGILLVEVGLTAQNAI